MFSSLQSTSDLLIRFLCCSHYTGSLISTHQGFLFLVVPYVHVLGLVLAHAAVITLSDAPIAVYNLTFF